jgi:ATP-binding cassette, subfamily B, bacterial
MNANAIRSKTRSRSGSELGILLRTVGTVWRLLPFRARAAFVLAALLMGFGAWVNARIPVSLGDLANTISAAQCQARPWAFGDAEAFLVGLALLFLVREVLHVVRKYLVHAATTDVEKRVTVDLVGHLMRVDLASLANDRIGALQGRIRRSAEGFIKLLKLGFMDFLPNVLIAVFAVSIALHRHVMLGLLMAAVTPVATYLVIRQIASQKGIRLQLLRSKEAVDAAVVEQLGGIEYVRAANTQDHEVQRVAEVCEAVRSRELRHHVQMSLFDFAKAINEAIFFIAVVAVSIALVARGDLPVGDIITFSMLFASILAPLREIHRIIDEAHESTLQVRDCLDLLAGPCDRSFRVTDPLEPNLDGTVPVIELRNFCLEYRTAEGKARTGLADVSVTIPANCTIGVAGRSGSGKSTWLRALLRLAHPSSGDMLVGGVSISRLSRQSLARHVAYVGQSPFLFAGTIAENISYGCETATAEQVRKAADQACMLDDILQMPGGFGAPVLERGRNLSGGQCQRIAIARAILKNAPILVLDEGTSAMDNTTEREVLDALTRAPGQRTIIMVAHRLSTLRDAQRIYVFDKGTIAQVGSFEELSAADGIFSELLASSAGHSPPVPSSAVVDCETGHATSMALR